MTNFHPADPSVADSPAADDDAAPPPDTAPAAAPPTAAGEPPSSPAPPPAPNAATPDAAPAPPPGDEAAPPSPVEPAAAVAPPPAPPPVEPEPAVAVAPPPAPTPVEPEPPTTAAPPPPLPPPVAPPEAPAEAGADAGASEPTSSPRARNWQAPLAALVVVAVVLGAFFLGRTSNGTDVNASAPSTTTATGGFVTFNDPQGGFTIQYPRQWERLETPTDNPKLAGSRLLVSAGKGHYLHVQVLLTNPATAKADVEQNLKEEGVNILAQEDITHNGMSGYSYLYSFVDEKTGLEAKHAHYVLLRGQKAYTLVFQAMPAADFDQLAPTFLQVIESFQSTSDSVPPVATAPTSAVPGSTAATTAPGR